MKNFDQFEISAEEMNNLEGGTWGCFTSFSYCAPKTSSYCAPKTSNYCGPKTSSTCAPKTSNYCPAPTTNNCQPKPSSCKPPVANLPIPATASAH